MRRRLWLILLGAALATAACQDEEEPPPPEEQPLKENTVQLVLSNAWDPYYATDGNKIVFVEAHHLTVLDLVTRQKTNITPDFGSADRCPRKPAWLKGDVVAFVRKDETSSKYRIWTVPAAGGDVKRSDVDVEANSSLAGDESGKYVYYTGDGDQLLYRLDLDTGEKLKLTQNHMTGFAHYDPVQKPGANFVYYVERQVPFNPQPHGEYVNEIWAGGNGIPRILLNTDKPFVEGLTVSPDDKYLVFPHRDGLFAYEYKRGVETWLTRARDKWTDKDRNPRYAPDSTHIIFTRANNVYICEAL
jgi:hypothetical protein